MWYKISWFGLKKTRVEINDPPKIGVYSIIKAKCSKCGKEYIVFDERYHGYNAVMTEYYKEYIEDIINYKEIKYKNSSSNYKIIMDIENDDSLDSFIDAVGAEVNEEEYIYIIWIF